MSTFNKLTKTEKDSVRKIEKFMDNNFSVNILNYPSEIKILFKNNKQSTLEKRLSLFKSWGFNINLKVASEVQAQAFDKNNCIKKSH
jgi:hypothetical protein